MKTYFKDKLYSQKDLDISLISWGDKDLTYNDLLLAYENTDLNEIAALTTGFSGADIENMANEAAILALRQNKTILNSTNSTFFCWLPRKSIKPAAG